MVDYRQHFFFFFLKTSFVDISYYIFEEKMEVLNSYFTSRKSFHDILKIYIFISVSLMLQPIYELPAYHPYIKRKHGDHNSRTGALIKTHFLS